MRFRVLHAGTPHGLAAEWKAAWEGLPGRDVMAHPDEHMHALLSGTVEGAYPLRPNDLLRHDAIEWGIAAGKKAYVLGVPGVRTRWHP